MLFLFVYLIVVFCCVCFSSVVDTKNRRFRTMPQKPSEQKSEENRSPARKLTKEEIDKTSERLVHRPPPPEIKDAVELSPRIVRDKEQIDKSVERLYTVAVEQKKKRLQEADSASHSKDAVKTVTRTPDEIEEGINRLYTQSIDSLKASRQKSQERYLHKPETHSPRMTIEESTQRLYTESLQKKKETREELFKKYVAATAVRCRKLSPEEIKASADRLCAKK